MPGFPASSHCEAAHYVQLYSDDIGPLAFNVGRFLAEGLSQGDAALVIAAPEHTDAFACQLGNYGCDVPEAIRTKRLVVLDASTTLAQLMPKGRVDWNRFEKSIDGWVRSLRSETGAKSVRVYGEMVGLLWNEGRTADTLHLEELWSRRQALGELKIYCGYQIDVFGHEFQDALAGRILAAHSCMLSGLHDDFGSAIQRAAVELLGKRAGSVGAGTAIPSAESAILWLRSEHPEFADEILARARAAMAPAA